DEPPRRGPRHAHGFPCNPNRRLRSPDATGIELLRSFRRGSAADPSLVVGKSGSMRLHRSVPAPRRAGLTTLEVLCAVLVLSIAATAFAQSMVAGLRLS